MKVYLSQINESWIVDKIRAEFYLNFSEIATNNIKKADIVWVIAPWLSHKIKTRQLKNKKVLCSVYHLDSAKKENNDLVRFKKFDKFVDQYHTISIKSMKDIQKITDKKVTEIPFWVDTKQFFHIDKKSDLRRKYGILDDRYLVGSFQRDSEGDDPLKPKLIKGPDIFLEIVHKIHKKNNKITVILTGKRRDYLISNFIKLGIDYKYFEMVDSNALNELYNLLDLYVVSSRLEGGPQAVVECATSKTPIVSTDVGMARQVLSDESIFDMNDYDSFFKTKANIDLAKNRVKRYETPQGYIPFIRLLSSIYEN